MGKVVRQLLQKSWEVEIDAGLSLKDRAGNDISQSHGGVLFRLNSTLDENHLKFALDFYSPSICPTCLPPRAIQCEGNDVGAPYLFPNKELRDTYLAANGQRFGKYVCKSCRSVHRY